jgi:hypothetical protein
MIETSPRRIALRGFGADGDEPIVDPSDPETSEVCDFFSGGWVVAVQTDLVEKKALDPKHADGLFNSATCAAYEQAYKELPTADNLVARYVPPDHFCLSVRAGCLSPAEEPGPTQAGMLAMKSFAAVVLVMGAVAWFAKRRKKR